MQNKKPQDWRKRCANLQYENISSENAEMPSDAIEWIKYDNTMDSIERMRCNVTACNWYSTNTTKDVVRLRMVLQNEDR